MSSGEARPLEEMRWKALGMMSLITDCCERIEIAGSIRREKEVVRDVELVAVPKFEGAINLLHLRLDTLLKAGYVSKRLNKNDHAISWGDRWRAMSAGSISIDVFIVLPDREWGPTMLLRTGPGAANQVLVTQEGVRNQEGDMGVCPRWLSWRDGALWKGEQRVRTPEERDVFMQLGLPYMHPSERTVALYQTWARRRGSIAAQGGYSRTVTVDMRPESRVVVQPSARAASLAVLEVKPVAVRLF